MFYYLIIFELFLYLILLLAKQNYKKIDRKKIFLTISFFVLAILLGLRSISVGIDTIAYSTVYNEYLKTKKFLIFNKIDINKILDYEILFYYSLFLFSKIGFSFTIYNLFYSIIVIGAFIKLIEKFSSNYFLSVLIFILTLYPFTFSTMRQSFAIAFCLFSFMLYYDDKKYFFIFYLIAILFHKTALIFFPMYLIKKINFNKVTFVIFILVGIVALIFRNDLIMFFIDHSRSSYNVVGISGLATTLYRFIVLITCIFLYCVCEDKNKIYIITAYISFLVMCIMNFNPTTFRLVYYFSSFEMLIIPWIFSHFKNTFEKYVLAAICVLFLFLPFYQTVSPNENKLNNYKFTQII